MFAAMADYFIRQIKSTRYFYSSQYKYIEKKARQIQKRNFFGAIVQRYIYSLHERDMSFFETESGKNLLKYIEEAISVNENETPNGHQYNVEINKKLIDPEKNELNIWKASVELEKANQMISIHNDNAIISLLIRFENFLNDYFEWLIKKYPDKYLSEKNIRYSELIKFDFDDLKEELTKEAANGIMSLPLNEWLKIIRSHKFDLEPLTDYLGEFTELYYRRNIIIHNKGKVNRQYLAGTKRMAAEYPLGKKLITDRRYVENAFDISMIFVYGILYASLKANVSDKEEYLEFLFNSGFNHMMEEDWRISFYIFGLLINDRGKDELTNILSQINYWISCKNMGKLDAVRDEIEAADYSAMNCSVRMAQEMLLEHYDLAVPLLEEAVSTELTPDAVETWPLFIQFRKTDYYKAFRTKYADRLQQQVINPEDLDVNKVEQSDMEEARHSFGDNKSGQEATTDE